MIVSVFLHFFLATVSLFVASVHSDNSIGGRKRGDEVNQSPHVYTFDEFKPGRGSFEQPYFRFLILFRMKEGVSKEESHEHWKTVHADLTMASKNTGVDILRYVQFHSDQEHRNMIQPILDGGGVVLAPYDGIAEFHARDAASLQRFISRAFADPQVSADEDVFVDKSGPLHLMAGYDNLIFGSEIATSGAGHGILPDDNRLQFE